MTDYKIVSAYTTWSIQKQVKNLWRKDLNRKAEYLKAGEYIIKLWLNNETTEKKRLESARD